MYHAADDVQYGVVNSSNKYVRIMMVHSIMIKLINSKKRIKTTTMTRTVMAMLVMMRK